VPLTRDFKQTIQARARRDPAFRRELLREAIESFLSGDVETGKAVLRDYIHATVGFDELAGGTRHSPKSLMRMLGPSGNPQARNLFEIVHYLQGKEKIRFKVQAAAARQRVEARSCAKIKG
jgi:DNA-binding phage protein